MNAEFRSFEPGIVPKPKDEGKPVLRENFSVDSDGVLEYKRQSVVLYIRNWYGENDWNKYHIVNCQWMKEMQKDRKYFRYVDGRPRDGKFIVNRPPDRSKSELLSLRVCQYCLEQLGLKSVYRPNEFPLRDWFDALDDGYEPLPVDRILSKNKYVAAWRFLSWVCRKNAGWKCQQCGIELGKERSDRGFLHAHHVRGRQYNRLEDLQALCICCHAEQPGESHKKLKSYTEYRDFMEKYGEECRSRNRLNPQLQQPRQNQRQSTLPDVQSDIIEDDVPF